MAQMDLILHQNVASPGVEWMERILTPSANSLLGFDASLLPADVTVGDGLALSSNQIKINITGLTANTTPSDTDVILIHDGTSNKKITRANFLSGIADSFTVKIDASATAGYIGATYNDGVLRTSSPLTYTDGGSYVTISIQDATTGQKGAVQIGSNINVTSGTISVSDADGTATKGVLKLSTTLQNGLSLSSGVLSLALATGATAGTVIVGTNIDVSTGTISVATATSSTKGVASFSSSDFSVTAGAVTLVTGVMKRVSAPATFDAAGSQYTFAMDDNYFYGCVQSGSWRRTSWGKWS